MLHGWSFLVFFFTVICFCCSPFSSPPRPPCVVMESSPSQRHLAVSHRRCGIVCSRPSIRPRSTLPPAQDYWCLIRSIHCASWLYWLSQSTCSARYPRVRSEIRILILLLIRGMTYRWPDPRCLRVGRYVEGDLFCSFLLSFFSLKVRPVSSLVHDLGWLRMKHVILRLDLVRLLTKIHHSFSSFLSRRSILQAHLFQMFYNKEYVSNEVKCALRRAFSMAWLFVGEKEKYIWHRRLIAL